MSANQSLRRGSSWGNVSKIPARGATLKTRRLQSQDKTLSLFRISQISACCQLLGVCARTDTCRSTAILYLDNGASPGGNKLQMRLDMPRLVTTWQLLGKYFQNSGQRCHVGDQTTVVLRANLVTSQKLPNRCLQSITRYLYMYRHL